MVSMPIAIPFAGRLDLACWTCNVPHPLPDLDTDLGNGFHGADLVELPSCWILSD
jgi:hypothetical protein